MKDLRPYIIISIMIHLAIPLVISLLMGGSEANPDEMVTVIPKIVEIEIIETPSDIPVDGSSDISMPEQKNPPEEGVPECEENKWYGGIGIESDFYTDVIDKVFQGYAADRIGLKVGDRILSVVSDSGKEIRGLPGTDIEIRVYRRSSDTFIIFKFKREKICIERGNI